MLFDVFHVRLHSQLSLPIRNPVTITKWSFRFLQSNIVGILILQTFFISQFFFFFLFWLLQLCAEALCMLDSESQLLTPVSSPNPKGWTHLDPDEGGSHPHHPACHRQHQVQHVRGAAVCQRGPRLQLGSVVHVHHPSAGMAGQGWWDGPYQVRASAGERRPL